MMPFSKRTFCVLDKPIGFTTLGGSMFTRGKILEHWQEVLTLQKVFQNLISYHYNIIIYTIQAIVYIRCYYTFFILDIYSTMAPTQGYVGAYNTSQGKTGKMVRAISWSNFE